ncbi:type IV pili twitching motility protein PilT, partial [bacterium CG_4_9_14_3_um_filter_33_26]
MLDSPEKIKANEQKVNLEDLLEITVGRSASDLHLLVGTHPTIRVDGRLIPLDEYPILTQNLAEKLIFTMISEEQKEIFLKEKELDLSIALGDEARFRVNLFYQRGTMGAALRLIPRKIRTLQEL